MGSGQLEGWSTTTFDRENYKGADLLQEFIFGTCTVVIPNRHPNGHVQQAITCPSLWLREERSGGTGFRCKVTKLAEITNKREEGQGIRMRYHPMLEVRR